MRYGGMKMKALIAIAVLLIVAAVILRVALAITTGLLHLLWIGALILGALWLWNKVGAKFGGNRRR